LTRTTALAEAAASAWTRRIHGGRHMALVVVSLDLFEGVFTGPPQTTNGTFIAQCVSRVALFQVFG